MAPGSGLVGEMASVGAVKSKHIYTRFCSESSTKRDTYHRKVSVPTGMSLRFDRCCVRCRVSLDGLQTPVMLPKATPEPRNATATH